MLCRSWGLLREYNFAGERRSNAIGMAISIAAVFVAIRWSTPALAQETTGRFDLHINPASMAEVLRDLEAATGISLTYSPLQVQHLQSSGVVGSLTVEQALSEILAGTTLSAKTNGNGAYVVIGPEASLRGAIRALAFGPAPVGSRTRASVTSADIDSVVVTASRIRRAGYEAPTPVTMTNADELEAAALSTIGDYLARLPSFGTAYNTSTPVQSTAGGQVGISFANLRQLGSARTLVLFDGRRVVNSTLIGGVDLGLIPEALVSRIDVVTGGASAAWGSDAVAGVVNIVVDKEYTGVATKLEASISQYGDTFEHKEEAVGGASFMGGRGHIVGSVSYSDRPRFTFQRQRNWPEHQGYGHTIADNPNYTPTNGQTRLLRFTGVGTANQTPGGVITSGPLKGTQFVGLEGTPTTYIGTNIGGTRAVGRDADLPIYDNGPLTNTLRTANVYSSVTYQINDNLDADLELNYGLSEGGQVSIYYTRPGNLTIFDDNAFLPAETRAAMSSNGITSFSLGKSHVETGMLLTEAYRSLYRGVAGFKGTAFDGWKWNAYYSHGQTRNSSKFLNNPLVPRYNLAVDAVLNPANGQIVCRSTLTNPGNGCLPFDVFGTAPQSASAKSWVFGVPGYQVIHLKQDVVAASISGSALEMWAGPVDLAVGVEARWEVANAISDEYSRARSYAAGNTLSLAPVKVGVKEAFAETNIPLVRNAQWARTFDFNAAVRVTDYSTSGVVVTWKAGLSYQINDDVRLRGTRSRDIRAPTMNELFSPGQIQTNTQFDPFSQTTLVARSNFKGNANLTPEIGDTWTGGVIYQPEWLANFEASVDYHDIQITDAIKSPTYSQVLFGCYTGEFPNYCPLIHFNAQGVAETVDLVGANIAEARTRGIDIETSYHFALGAGDLSLRAIATYNLELSTVENGIYVDSSGIVGNASEGTAGGIPKTKIVGRLQYDLPQYTLALEGQYAGAAKLNRAWTTSDLSPEDNRVDSVILFNLRAAYEFETWGPDARVYLSIDNVMNQAPPVVATRADGRGGTAIAPTFSYERLGRMFRLGLRANF